MIRVQPNGTQAMLSAVLCVISLCVLPAPAGSVVTPSASSLPGCGPTPAWIEAATLPDERQGPLGSCFSSSSSQAEAQLSVANRRPYAQLITVSGAPLDLSGSAFASSLDGTLARLFANVSSSGGPAAILLGPGERVTLAIDRPAPGAAQRVHVEPAPDNAFAVAAVAFRLLSVATRHRSLSTATQSCIVAAVRGVLLSPRHPEQAARRIHSCLNAAGRSSNLVKRVQKLAYQLLGGHFFREVFDREGAEPDPARIAFTISSSNPNLINPGIHLGPASFGTVPSAMRTVEHLSASGGTPPYRFYIVPEPGGPGVPSWLHLASDGTLILEPPAGATSVNLPVEVVDSNGEHSVVPY